MKRIKLISFFLCMTALTSLSDCDRDEPKTEMEKLPPITQEGKNTFGCLVNGKAWITKTSIDANAVYQANMLQISAGLVNKDFNQFLYFVINNPSEQEFLLNDTLKYRVELTDLDTNCRYVTNGLIGSGKIMINKLDTRNRIASGTFDFKVQNTNCIELNVTDGRFDLTLIL